ncbi:MAG: LuxR C-terminal-related transcriptional regulator [Polyangia bacterium]
MLRIDHARVVDLVDACYQPRLDEQGWIERLLDVLRGISQARSAMFMRIRTSYDAQGLLNVDEVGGFTAIGPDVGPWTDETRRAVLGSPARELTFGRTHGNTFSAAMGVRPGVIETLPGWRQCWRAPIVDSLGIVGRDAHGDGFVASVGLDTTQTLTPKEVRLLTKLATHVCASQRLRTHAVTPDAADAVLSAHGKVLHVTDVAQHDRAALDDGHRRRDAAKKSAHDADRALEIWQGLVAGKWSLVDHFDSDGKRFVLAMKNAPEVDPRVDLTPLERRVSSLASMGHRDKEIAYSLGITMPSVAAALHRARTKIGVTSRAALAAAWRRNA